MSKREQLVRPLKGSERRIIEHASVPGTTRSDLYRARLKEVEAHLQAAADGYELVYGPKVITNLVTEDGADHVNVTGFVIVGRKFARGGVVRGAGALVGDQGGPDQVISAARLRSLQVDPKGMGWIAPSEYVPPPKPPEQVPNAGVGIPDAPRGLIGDWVKPHPIREALQAARDREAVEGLDALFADYVFRAAEQKNEALREIAEKMLLDGTMGIVMIQVDGPQDFTAGHETNSYSLFSYTKWALHPWVPFGHIFEFTSEESFLAWLERGPEQ